MRLRLRIGLLAIGVTCLLGCRPAFRRVQPPGAGFAVEMPANTVCDAKASGRPTAEGTWVEQSCSGRADSPLLDWQRSAVPHSIDYEVTWIELPPKFRGAPIDAVLEGYAAPRLPTGSSLLDERKPCDCGQGLDAKYPERRSSRSLPLGGEPGIQQEDVGELWLAGMLYRTRIAIHNDRIYWLAISGRDGLSFDPIWARMVESFAFDPDPSLGTSEGSGSRPGPAPWPGDHPIWDTSWGFPAFGVALATIVGIAAWRAQRSKRAGRGRSLVLHIVLFIGASLMIAFLFPPVLPVESLIAQSAPRWAGLLQWTITMSTLVGLVMVLLSAGSGKLFRVGLGSLVVGLGLAAVALVLCLQADLPRSRYDVDVVSYWLAAVFFAPLLALSLQRLTRKPKSG